jgi:CRISPR-associated protein Cas2
MWVFVLYDLPTETASHRKAFALFRKNVMKDGFQMFQFSIYIRHCPSRENAEVHIKRVKSFLPKEGNVCIFLVTDQQFNMMQLFRSGKASEMATPTQQLELF